MRLSDDQFSRQISYESSLHIITGLWKKRLITDDELNQAKSYLIDKYTPVIKH